MVRAGDSAPPPCPRRPRAARRSPGGAARRRCRDWPAGEQTQARRRAHEGVPRRPRTSRARPPRTPGPAARPTHRHAATGRQTTAPRAPERRDWPPHAQGADERRPRRRGRHGVRRGDRRPRQAPCHATGHPMPTHAPDATGHPMPTQAPDRRRTPRPRRRGRRRRGGGQAAVPPHHHPDPADLGIRNGPQGSSRLLVGRTRGGAPVPAPCGFPDLHPCRRFATAAGRSAPLVAVLWVLLPPKLTLPA